jgi:hypothetical protein
MLSAKELDYDYKNISIRHLQTCDVGPTQVSYQLGSAYFQQTVLGNIFRYMY